MIGRRGEQIYSPRLSKSPVSDSKDELEGKELSFTLLLPDSKRVF
jgi:hypothetical protein